MNESTPTRLPMLSACKHLDTRGQEWRRMNADGSNVIGPSQRRKVLLDAPLAGVDDRLRRDSCMIAVGGQARVWTADRGRLTSQPERQRKLAKDTNWCRGCSPRSKIR